MGKEIEIFEKVTVRYDRGSKELFIDDYDEDEQLAMFKVVEDE